MPLTKRTVYNTVLDPAGNPVKDLPVIAWLYYASYYKPDPSQEVITKVVETKTDENGYWQLDLVPNSLLTPDDTFYLIREGDTLHYVWIPLGDGTPIALSAVELGRCASFGGLVGVTGIGVEGNIVLRRNVILKSGKAIGLEQDNDNRTITINNAGVTGLNAEGYDSLIGDIALKSGKAISLNQDNNNRIITINNAGVTGLSTEGNVPLIDEITLKAGKAILLDQDNNSRIITINNAGVTGLKADSSQLVTGDIEITTTNGLRSTVDPNIPRITLKSTHAIFLPPDCFRPYGTEVGSFHLPTNITIPYQAFHYTPGSGWYDVTNILTDDDTTTYVTLHVYGPIHCFLNYPEAVHQLRAYVGAVTGSPVIRVSVYDSNDNILTYVDISPQANAWISALLYTPIHARKIVLGIPPYIGGTCDIAEVRFDMSHLVPEQHIKDLSATDGKAEGLCVAMVFLYAGWTYKWQGLFGVTKTPTSDAQAEGRIYTPSGERTVFYPLQGFSGAAGLKVLTGTLPQITQTGFYKIVWRLRSLTAQSAPSDYHCFCGMQIEFE